LKNAVSIVLGVLVVLIIGYIIYSDYINPKPTEVNEVVVSYGVPDFQIPDTVLFAGERVPLEIPDVRERLDREINVNSFWHSNTIFLLKRGKRWLPRMRKIFEEYDIPSDLVYLSVIESDLQNKVSPSKAVGFWQLLRGTAKDFKLEVTSEVDERYNPIKSTEAAAKYLKKAYQKFGTWTNAAASYNIGRRGLDRALSKQEVSSYYDLLLYEETSRYVFRAIAVKMIFEDPAAFGFNISEENLYVEENLKEIKIKESISNLRHWAFDQGINYKILKRYNPWLRKNTLTVKSGKSYVIQIPRRAKSMSSDANITIMPEIESDSVPDIREAPTDTEEDL
jgi:hypothetical protein